MRMNSTLAKCRGQSYDSASNMSGTKKGVAKQKIIGHSINLAISDSISINIRS